MTEPAIMPMPKARFHDGGHVTVATEVVVGHQGNTASKGAKAIMPTVMPASRMTSPRVRDSARHPSRMFASTCWSSVVASWTVGIFASAKSGHGHELRRSPGT